MGRPIPRTRSIPRGSYSRPPGPHPSKQILPYIQGPPLGY